MELLKVSNEIQKPVATVTLNSLVEWDIDILSSLAREGLTRVGIFVTTPNVSIASKLEPRVPSPKRRLIMIERLSKASPFAHLALPSDTGSGRSKDGGQTGIWQICKR